MSASPFFSDLHVHTNRSLCAPRTTEPASYVPYCEAEGIRLIGISDHVYPTDMIHAYGYPEETRLSRLLSLRPAIEEANKASHVDEDIDEKCDICNAYVLHEHFFGVIWQSDEVNHWHECICGECTGIEVHADADFDEKCDVCQAYVLHEHAFADTWQSDEISHWKVCPCGETAEIAAHVDTNHDEVCDTCEAYVPHEHDFGTTWTTNESGHWQICVCGERTSIYAHADKNKDHRCDTCAYVVSLPDPPKLYGHSAFIYDSVDKDYLFKKVADMPLTSIRFEDIFGSAFTPYTNTYGTKSP
jgi:hypothetical protein